MGKLRPPATPSPPILPPLCGLVDVASAGHSEADPHNTWA